MDILEKINFFSVFLIGSLIGSFLNVVIYRFPKEKSIAWPGSRCPKCNNDIKFYDNVPILSWVILGGKCRYCKNRISVRYPLTEMISAVIFVLIYLSFGISWKFIFLSYFVTAMIVIFWIDIDYMVILNSATYLCFIVGFLYSFINGNILESLVASFSGWLFFYLIMKLSLFFLKKEGMGRGDVTLVGVLGIWLGIKGLIGTIIISFFIGSLVGLLLFFIRKKSVPFPFGPFLVIGALFSLLTDNFLLDLYLKNFI